jgi:hypothetical protein
MIFSALFALPNMFNFSASSSSSPSLLLFTSMWERHWRTGPGWPGVIMERNFSPRLSSIRPWGVGMSVAVGGGHKLLLTPAEYISEQPDSSSFGSAAEFKLYMHKKA